MEISEDLIYYDQILRWNKSPYRMAHLHGIIQDPRTGKEAEQAHRFLLDTGAAISILNSEFNSFFDGSIREFDRTKIQYGGNVVDLPVYRLILKIKGNTLNLPMAHDCNMRLPSLLGQYGFLNNLIGMNIDYISKSKSKIYWT